ncbi:MAG: carboxypeptidase regulatory-like domain-containing protein [Acidobacteria bacterium]|nr:carboxypeptidase regulatory-like domain-containing protein [Acidobacteriota bacterium]
MSGRKFLAVACAALFVLTAAAPASAQKKKQKQQEQPTTGNIVGRVKVAPGSTPGGVAVTVRRGDEEVARHETNQKGEFEFEGLAPGTYGLTLRKVGLEVGRMEGVEVRAGRTVSLKDRLYLPVDDGAIAHIRGSVFDAGGHSVGGAKVELSRVEADGSVKKLDDRVSNSTGSFAFRLSPEHGRYRLTAKADGAEAVSEEVNVDGAAIYRVALSFRPRK